MSPSNSILILESRRSLELPLAAVVRDGAITVYPHVEAKGLLFVQFRKGKVTLTAGKYVGLIPLTPDITVDVRPKLPVGNLSRVLDRARIAIDAIEGVDRLYLHSQGSSSASILEFLLSNLVNASEPVRERGVLKEYVRKTANVTHPRGRLKVTGTLQSCRARGIEHKVQVERFELTSDVIVNRVLRAGLVYLLSAFKSLSPNRELLKRANDAYNDLPEQIGAMTSTDYERCRGIVVARALPLSRSYYYRALEIALLALSNQTVSLEKPGDDLLLDTFIIDFERVFELYLRRSLEAFADANIAVHDGNNEGKKPLFDDRAEPPAQPDIVILRRDSGHKLIIEVKYKDKPDRADINQAVTYALTYRSERVVLVHQARPGGAAGLYRLGVISGIAIEAYAFDLGRADLRSEEAVFAETLLGMVSPKIPAAA